MHHFFKKHLSNTDSASTGVDTTERRISKLVHIYWVDLNLAEEIQDTDVASLNNMISI